MIFGTENIEGALPAGTMRVGTAIFLVNAVFFEAIGFVYLLLDGFFRTDPSIAKTLPALDAKRKRRQDKITDAYGFEKKEKENKLPVVR